MNDSSSDVYNICGFHSYVRNYVMKFIDKVWIHIVLFSGNDPVFSHNECLCWHWIYCRHTVLPFLICSNCCWHWKTYYGRHHNIINPCLLLIFSIDNLFANLSIPGHNLSTDISLDQSLFGLIAIARDTCLKPHLALLHLAPVSFWLSHLHVD